MLKLSVNVGDTVICIDDDSDDEDFGASGLVLSGRRDLKLNKEYLVEEIETRHVPKEKHGDISDDEFKRVQEYWVQIRLKGIVKLCWLHHFKVKK